MSAGLPHITGAGAGARRIRIATRASRLARWQTDWVAARLRATSPGLAVEIIEVTTTGDRVRNRSLAAIGRTGVFTKELEELLLAGEADIAVHSLKDVETTLPDGLALLALPAREDPRDALLCRATDGSGTLPTGACVGTSSLRRRAQLASWRGDLRFVDLRGNVPTRLDKLSRGADGIDATILAVAGLTRLGYADRITEIIDPVVLVPAAGQGTLAIEGRQDDARVREILRPLDDALVRATAAAERAWLRRLEGGCQVPAGALARITRVGAAAGSNPDELVAHAALELRAAVCTLDGSLAIRDVEYGGAADAVAIGERLAERMLSQGAAPIVAAVAAAVRGSATPDGALPGDAATASPATVGAAPHDASGGRVAITRRATLAASLAAALRTRGIEVLALPTIRIDPPADREALARAAAVLEEFDWVVLTSTNAARALVHCRRPPWPASLQVACVGRATAAAVEQHGQRVHLVPGEQHGAGLLAALSPRLEEGRAETPPGTALLHQAVRVLLPLSSIARRTVPDGLRAAGAEVVEVEAYRTVPDEAGARRLLDGVRSGTIDAVVVTSPSSLAALLEAAAADTSRHAGRAPDAPGPTAPAPSGHTAAWPYRVPLVAIGATTAAAMREHGVEPAAEAPSPDVPGMVAALDSLWKQRTHRAGEATG